MENEKKIDQPEIERTQPYKFSDEGTKRKIKKHLSDINDVITEQDIANVKVPGEDEPLPTHFTDQDFEKQKKEDDKEENFPEGKPITPWDVID